MNRILLSITLFALYSGLANPVYSQITFQGSVTVTVDTGQAVAGFSDSVTFYDIGIPVMSVSFTDASLNVNSWLWDFGDGNTDTVQNPYHSYGSVGSFDVTLTVTNACGSGSVTQTSGIFSGLGLPHGLLGFSVYPNPFTKSTVLEYSLAHDAPVTLKLFNVLGEEVQVIEPETQQKAGMHQYRITTTGNESPGNYLLRMEVDGAVIQRSLVSLKK